MKGIHLLQTFINILTLLGPSTLSYTQEKLYCSIQFMDSVMIGQESYFEVHLKNPGRKSLEVNYDPVGNNFNHLKRDQSFTLKVTDVNGNIIPNKASTPDEITMISRRVGYQELHGSDSRIYRHYIHDWVDLAQPGEYKIDCSKEYNIKKRKRKYLTSTIGCEASFELMAFDSTKYEKDVHNLWREIKSLQDYSDRQVAMDLFCRSESKTIIPYLEQVIDSSRNISEIQTAMKGLSKFTENQEVFHMLSRVFEYEDSRFRKQVAREELLSSLMDNIKHAAIIYISGFDDSLVNPYLRKHHQDKSYAVRLYIMQELHRRKDAEAEAIITINLQDVNERVRKEAEFLMSLY